MGKGEIKFVDVADKCKTSVDMSSEQNRIRAPYKGCPENQLNTLTGVNSLKID